MSTGAASPSDRALVVEAQRLRDYLLRHGGIEQADLVDALMPFEHESGTEPSMEQRRALFAAFQNVKRQIAGVVDDYTIDKVLNGRSPFTEFGSTNRRFFGLLRSVGVAVFGIFLVSVAFFYTDWSNRASLLVREAERFTSFDHVKEILRLVELARSSDMTLADAVETAKQVEVAVEAGSAQPGAAGRPRDFDRFVDPETIIVYEAISGLRRHYQVELYLSKEMREHAAAFDILADQKDLLRQRFCDDVAPTPEGRFERVEPPGGAVGRWFVKWTIGCTDVSAFLSAGPPQGGSQGMQTNGGQITDTARAGFETVLFRRVDDINRTVEQEVYTLASRASNAGSYAQSLRIVENFAQDLSGKIDTIHRWGLPILYGMLGSIVYCMWRILTPAIAPLDLLYTLMRTAFAGLAALTLSMLIVPSNMLSLGADVSRPFVYLLAFIFGYSIEVFVGLLNNLNGYFGNRLKTRRGDGDDAAV
jgi:hypothetical protein